MPVMCLLMGLHGSYNASINDDNSMENCRDF